MTDPAPQPAPPSWLRIVLIGRRPSYTLARIVVVVAGAFLLFGFMVLPVRVDGPSMLPTYRSGGVNFVNRLAYFRREPQRFDVVTIRISGAEYSPGELWGDLWRLRVNVRRLFRPSVMYMKRVVGLPGETIAFVGGQLLVNGQPLEEAYLRFSCRWEQPPRTLGPDQYFVVGDNRSMRLDEHTFGVPERARIVGKVML